MASRSNPQGGGGSRSRSRSRKSTGRPATRAPVGSKKVVGKASPKGSVKKGGGSGRTGRQIIREALDKKAEVVDTSPKTLTQRKAIIKVRAEKAALLRGGSAALQGGEELQAIKEKRVTEEDLTTKEEFIKSLETRLGGTVTTTSQGIVSRRGGPASAGGRTRFFGTSGEVIEAPSSAKFRTGFRTPKEELIILSEEPIRETRQAKSTGLDLAVTSPILGGLQAGIPPPIPRKGATTDTLAFKARGKELKLLSKIRTAESKGQVARAGVLRGESFSTIFSRESVRRAGGGKGTQFKAQLSDFSLAAGIGFGKAIQAPIKHPVRTGLFVGGTILVLSGVGAGAGALGISAGAAKATVGAGLVGGFVGIKAKRDPSSVFTVPGAVSTATELGTFLLGAKAVGGGFRVAKKGFGLRGSTRIGDKAVFKTKTVAPVKITRTRTAVVARKSSIKTVKGVLAKEVSGKSTTIRGVSVRAINLKAEGPFTREFTIMKVPGVKTFVPKSSLGTSKRIAGPKVKAIETKGVTQTVTTGTLRKGFDKFDVRIVQRGRSLSGTLTGTSKAVRGQQTVFKKISKGKLKVKQLISRKDLPSDTAVGRVKTSIVKFKPEVFKTSGIKTQAPKLQSIEVGKGKGGDISVITRVTRLPTKFTAVGKTKEIVGGREVTKTFKGRGAGETLQIDEAGLQITTTKVGTGPTIKTARIPTIKLADQPKFDPSKVIVSTKTVPASTKRVRQLELLPKFRPFGEGNFIHDPTKSDFNLGFKTRIVPVAGGKVSTRISIKQPPLETTTIKKLTTETTFTVQRSRFKPFETTIDKTIGGLKKFEDKFVPKNFDFLFSKPLGKRGTAKLAFKPRVTIESSTPSRVTDGIKIASPVDAKTLFKIVPKVIPIRKTFLAIPPIIDSVSRTETITFTRTPSKSRTRVRPSILSIVRPRVESRVDTPLRIQPASRTETRAETSTTTRLRTRTTTRTPTTTTPFIPVPTPGPPPTTTTPPLLIPGLGLTKGKKRKRRKGIDPFFNPSLAASSREIFGETPRTLTGIELRPIPIGRVRLAKT